ncbi:hypothetical protein [Dyadobacter sp. Leaf189]|uniref:hypothetical protein n=1 Tax=Dyadobacter sp. Leaf189 TaxID=1736295 RepID=UPI0006F9675D|nr:hypothetical protein [Dyadobacter sp. Leaf189]KQS31188.1 hypothetical protein ASG33_12685 [Dyadobacter sp. Leaf189]
MNNIKTFLPGLCLLVTAALGLTSCKEEDPFLDRNVAPVLVDIVGAPFGAPLASTPSVAYDSSMQELVLTSRLLELDKTNILDHTKGIDSIPVPNIAMKVSFDLTKTVKPGKVDYKGVTYNFTAETFKAAGVLGEVTSDANGVVTLKTTYKALGLTGNRIQRKDDIIKLSWTGTHKGIAFTRTSQMAVTKN